MRISIGMHLRDGPWGGGNQFGNALAKCLQHVGHSVSFDLQDPDLDIILLAVVMPTMSVFSYGEQDIFRYLQGVNDRAIVVHRVNECDERKGTDNVNLALRRANLCADHTVFVSSWLRTLHLAQGMPARESSVILNGSDRATFNSVGYQPWNHREPLRIATHHWSGGWMKGFDIYQRLDELLGEERYRSRYQFTYIGNLPDGFRFRNAIQKSPLYGIALAAELRSHHVYLTASQNEPGGNHQNEGANCGLPLLYRLSGSMPEYCDGYGIGFVAEDFVEKLEEMYATYDKWSSRMTDFPHTAERLCARYLDLFQRLLAEEKKVFAYRRRLRYWQWRLGLIR